MFESMCLCGVAIIIIIVHIVLAVWVYRDAEKRGEEPVLWLIVFLVAGIIGLIIWLIVRPTNYYSSDFKSDNPYRDDELY
ncbi:MAG: hypothetical protein R6W73_04705 [Candidatus Saliniplasma sp.]